MNKTVTSTFFGICIVGSLLMLTGCEQEQNQMPKDARPIDKELFEAVVNDDVQKVINLIESGADSYALTTSDHTLLMHMLISTSDLSPSTVALVTTVSPQEIAALKPHILLVKSKEELLKNPAIDRFIEQKIFKAKAALHTPRPEESETRDMFYELGLDVIAPNVTIASSSKYTNDIIRTTYLSA